MMKKLISVLFIVIMVALTGCEPAPKEAASTFMKSLQNRNFEKAAATCGVSKDEQSKQIVMALLLEQYGTTDNSIRSYTVKADTIMKDEGKAIVYMDLIYTNRTKEQNVPIYLRKMGNKWVVLPFENR